MVKILKYGIIIIVLCTTHSCIIPKPLSKQYKSIRQGLKSPDRVLNLDLSNQNLTTLPKEIFKFKNLGYINLSNNNFKSFPTELLSFTKLKFIDLSHNQIDYLPSEIGEFQNLSRLILNNNLLTEIPEEITKLKNLELLLLVENNLNPEKIESIIKQMPQNSKVIYYY